MCVNRRGEVLPSDAAGDGAEFQHRASDLDAATASAGAGHPAGGLLLAPGGGLAAARDFVAGVDARDGAGGEDEVDGPRAGKAARFDASTSTDPDGNVAHFTWDFGDGTVLVDGGPEPTHVYLRPGTYTVTLTVTDNENCSTRQVFTGSQTLCNGSAAAQSSQPIAIQH